MRKLIIILVLIFAAAPAFAQEDKESISEIQEEASYEKGEYSVDSGSTSLTVKKGEGFDFKIPEIVITGQVDTRILLKREITSLENLQNVKNILYEEEKVKMPYYYMKEEEITPQAGKKVKSRDFVGKIKAAAGTYNRILVDGIIGKVFDPENNAILRIIHENYNNPRINDRDTYRNLNSLTFYYNTVYGPMEALYSIEYRLNQFTNPYTSTIFLNHYFNNDFRGSISLSGDIKGIDSDILLKYGYFDQKNSGDLYIYKENRLEAKVSLEKDLNIEKDKKIKTILDFNGYYSGMDDAGTMYTGVVNTDLFFKAIFYFEPVIFRGGVRIQYYSFSKGFFRMSPYAGVNYDIVPQASLYAVFKPRMFVPDYTEMLKTPFVRVNTAIDVPVENVNLRAGANLNFSNVFLDIYYAHMSVKDNIYLDDPGFTNTLSYYNDDIDYNVYGIKAETLKLKNFSAVLDYSYRNLIGTTAPVATYFPYHVFTAEIMYNPSGWEFIFRAKVESEQMGTTTGKISPYGVLDFSASREIIPNFTLSGYINNILNNNYYLIYYYKERGLNLGLSAEVSF